MGNLFLYFIKLLVPLCRKLSQICGILNNYLENKNLSHTKYKSVKFVIVYPIFAPSCPLYLVFLMTTVHKCFKIGLFTELVLTKKVQISFLD